MKKVIVFVSAPEAEQVREAIVSSGGDKLGNYSESVQPALAIEPGLRVINEEKIEFACDDETFSSIQNAIERLASHFTAVEAWSI